MAATTATAQADTTSTSPSTDKTTNAVPTIITTSSSSSSSSLLTSTSVQTSSRTTSPLPTGNASSSNSSDSSSGSTSSPASLPSSSSSLLHSPSGSAFSSTTPALTSPTTLPNSSVSSNGLGPGAVAGIAVGCCVGGIFIGVLIAFLFLRRRPKSSSTPDLVEARPDAKSFDSQPFPASPDGVSSAAPDLDKYLAIPQSDRELSSELQSLGHLVQQHVEDNYHLEPVTESIESLEETLRKLGISEDEKGTPSPTQLTTMAINPDTRHVALQHVIMRVIFMSLSAKPAGKFSLLPSTVTSLIQETPPVEKHLGNPEALSLALNRLRQISAFLLNPARSERGVLVPNEDVLQPQVKALVTGLNAFLNAFVTKEDRFHQESHLQDVVLECARFGYVVFSQPAEFLWQFKSEGEGEIVVCPGLEKTSNNHGVDCTPEIVATPELQKI